MAETEPRDAAMPQWERLRPKQRTEAKPLERSANDDLLLDALTHPGFHVFLRQAVLPEAARIHKEMVNGNAAAQGMTSYMVHVGAMRALLKVFEAAYEKAGLDMPIMLRIILSGEMISES
jgi:hypothetical protein